MITLHPFRTCRNHGKATARRRQLTVGTGGEKLSVRTMSQATLWLAICITVFASSANSVGKALQKQATANLPKLSFDRKVLLQYTRNRTWTIGLLADLLGGVVQVVAFAIAPVSVIQPISGVGLVGLAVYSHYALKERLSDWEWGAVGMAGVGTTLLGACSSGSPASQEREASAGQPASTFRMIFSLLLSGIFIVALGVVRNRRQRRRNKSNLAGEQTVPALYGLQAGGCFGLSAAVSRTGFLLASTLGWVWPILGLSTSIALSATGFVLQTKGLKDGSTVVVCTCVAVTSMVAGVLIGVLGLGEDMSGSFTVQIVRLSSWCLIMLGVVSLAVGIKGMVKCAADLVPDPLLQFLPVTIAVQIKSLRGGGDGHEHHLSSLPEILSDLRSPSHRP